MSVPRARSLIQIALCPNRSHTTSPQPNVRRYTVRFEPGSLGCVALVAGAGATLDGACGGICAWTGAINTPAKRKAPIIGRSFNTSAKRKALIIGRSFIAERCILNDVPTSAPVAKKRTRQWAFAPKKRGPANRRALLCYLVLSDCEPPSSRSRAEKWLSICARKSFRSFADSKHSRFPPRLAVSAALRHRSEYASAVAAPLWECGLTECRSRTQP